MALNEINDCGELSSGYIRHEMSSSYNSIYEEANSLVGRGRGTSLEVHDTRSPDVIRPCYYILEILGMWKPRNGNFEFLWRVYRAFVFVLWFACLAAIMCLDFVHYGFKTERIHVREIMNSVGTCLVFLCPFVFTFYYFNQGQFVEVVSSVQNVSEQWYKKLHSIARWYTLMSVLLWGICGAFFMLHWFPFFSKPWHYAVYVPVVVYISGWWGTWLTIYGFVCHVHSLQIDTVVEEMKSTELKPTTILLKYSQLQISLEKTQKDFNVIISLALTYHTLDLIVFSFAFFNSAFGSDYPVWQYVGSVLFDLTSLVFKLYPPAIVAAAAHRIVVQAYKRCQVSSPTMDLPLEDMQLFQHMALCEPDMGLKILGIRITVQLSLQLLMTIATVAISFVAFAIPHLK